MWFLCKLRFKQAYRLLQETGWGILLILVLVTAGLWAPALIWLSDLPARHALVIGLALAGWLHLWRSDRDFLHQTERHPWKVYFLDTSLLLLPGTIFFLLSKNFDAAAAWYFGAVVVLLPGSTLANIRYMQPRFDVPWMPVQWFELYTSLRSFPAGWVLAALLQLGTWDHIAFFVAAIVWGLMLASSMFQTIEPGVLLPRGQRSLLAKWRHYALLWFIFYLPGTVQALIWQTDYLWLVAYALVALEAYLALVFFYKYAVWRPGLQGLSGNAYGAVGILLVLIPGMLLIALPMVVWAAFRARKKVANWNGEK